MYNGNMVAQAAQVWKKSRRIDSLEIQLTPQFTPKIGGND